MTGQIDVVVFMTGVGIRLLMAQLDRQVDRKRFLESLSDVITIARGPKPTAGPARAGPDADASHARAEHVARSARGVRRPRAAGESLGRAHRIWPDERQPAGRAGSPRGDGACVEGLSLGTAGGPRPVGSEHAGDRRRPKSTWPCSPPASRRRTCCTIAERMGLAKQVRGGLAQAVVASIGPDTSETLRQLELPIDFEPEHSAMGQLIAAAADRAGRIVGEQSGAVPLAAPVPPRESLAVANAAIRRLTGQRGTTVRS